MRISDWSSDVCSSDLVEEEYLLSGAAARYAVIGAQTPDGRWTLKPGERRPFATRLLVRRPRDLKRFNGTLLVEWMNVSLGFDVSFLDGHGLYDGFVYRWEERRVGKEWCSKCRSRWSTDS